MRLTVGLLLLCVPLLCTSSSAAARTETGVEYARPGGKPLLLDLSIPDGKGPFPAAILVHGGGFDEGMRSIYISPAFDVLTRGGYAWFSIDYRLAPTYHFRDASADLTQALRWLNQNSARYHVDPNRIALVGESAGGFLVNYAGTHGASVRAVVDFYGPADYAALALARQNHPEQFNMKAANQHLARGGNYRFFEVEKLDEPGLAKLREVSPMSAVHRGMPPFLCIHGNHDDQVSYEQSVQFCDAIRKAGSTCDLITVEGGGHGMTSWKTPEMQNWKSGMIEWLDRTMQLTNSSR